MQIFKSVDGVSAVALAVCLTLGASFPAEAYIDPGSGSMIMSTILGVIAAIGYTMRKSFYRVRNLFRGKSADSDAGKGADAS